jgi:hypothetical protein
LKNFFITYYRPLLWGFFIAVLCGIPGKDLPQASWLDLLSFDKLVHASLFFILVFLFRQSHKNFRQQQGYVLAGCIAYGGLLELMQEWIFVDRTADWMDFAANTTGCLAAAVLFRNRLSPP